jgi:AcrR family transcriptional regulator
MTSRSTPRRNGRLSRLDWLEAGQAILCENGIAGLKLAALTRRLHVSTGSFYHHFPDFEAYLNAVADHFTADQVRDTLRQASDGNAGPLTRMRRIRSISVKTRLFQLDSAMRIWAATDARAAATMRAAERIVLEFLTQAFRDLGYARNEAALRARVLLSANVARIEATSPPAGKRFFKETLAFLTRDAPKVRSVRHVERSRGKVSSEDPSLRSG